MRGAGIISYSEPHTSKERADIVIQFNHLVVVLEFKFAAKTSDIERLKHKGTERLIERGYAEGYDGDGRKMISAVLVVDNENRKVII